MTADPNPIWTDLEAGRLLAEVFGERFNDWFAEPVECPVWRSCCVEPSCPDCHGTGWAA